MLNLAVIGRVANRVGMTLTDHMGGPDGDRAHLVTAETRHRFRSGYWTPTRGTRLPDDCYDLTARCRAVLLAVGDRAAFTGMTALALWDGVEVREGPIEVTVESEGVQIQREGVTCRRRVLPSRDVTIVEGLPVTTPQRTFVDLARSLRVPRLVAVGDDLLRRGLLNVPDIDDVLKRSRRQRGVRSARRARELLDPRAESPRESIVRAIIIEAGLPVPVPQVEIFDRYGRFIARGDLVYPDMKIVIEYDGAHHLTRPAQERDAQRRGLLGIDGWLVVTVVPSDVERPHQLVVKVVTAIAARRTRPR